jgi:hypothetical protein
MSSAAFPSAVRDRRVQPVRTRHDAAVVVRNLSYFSAQNRRIELHVIGE